MWASPKERTPGVSITQPPSASGKAIADVDVCRPCRRRSPSRWPGRRPAPGVDQCRLADPGMTDHHRHRLAAPECLDGVDLLVAAPRWVTWSGRDRRTAIRPVPRDRTWSAPTPGPGRRCRRRPGAVDETGARHRVRKCADDHQLVGVGHQDPFRRVGVVGGPPENAAPLGDRTILASVSGAPSVSPTDPTRRRPPPRDGRVPLRAWRSPVRASFPRRPARIPTGPGRPVTNR